MGGGPNLGDLDDGLFAAPDDALLDTTDCPVAAACAGCGATSGLHAVTTALSKPGGHTVGCATLCPACDGRSFPRLLGPDGISAAFDRHTAHATGPA